MVSHLSAKVYNGHVRGAKENGQNDAVISLMRSINEPLTIRMILYKLYKAGYEIDLVSLRRAVHNLTMGKNCSAMLKVMFEAPCPISHKTVGWYGIREQYRFRQGELFKE